jgi:hypothetical protein
LKECPHFKVTASGRNNSSVNRQYLPDSGADAGAAEEIFFNSLKKSIPPSTSY